MVGGLSRVVKDVPPYMLSGSSDAGFRVVGPNVVGLTRRGYARESISALDQAARLIYHKGLNRTQALEAIEREVEQTEEVRYLVSFFRNSKRGVF